MTQHATIPDYKSFFNPQALEMLSWMYEATGFTKHHKRYLTACKLEHKFRRHHHIDTYGNWNQGTMVTIPTPMYLLDPKLQSPPSDYDSILNIPPPTPPRIKPRVMFCLDTGEAIYVGYDYPDGTICFDNEYHDE